MRLTGTTNGRIFDRRTVFSPSACSDRASREAAYLRAWHAVGDGFIVRLLQCGVVLPRVVRAQRRCLQIHGGGALALAVYRQRRSQPLPPFRIQGIAHTGLLQRRDAVLDRLRHLHAAACRQQRTCRE
jgi:hypothetical protein